MTHDERHDLENLAHIVSALLRTGRYEFRHQAAIDDREDRDSPVHTKSSSENYGRLQIGIWQG